MRVGSTWLPRMQKMQAGTDGDADIPLLKLFEFLTASMCEGAGKGCMLQSHSSKHRAKDIISRLHCSIALLRCLYVIGEGDVVGDDGRGVDLFQSCHLDGTQ